MYTLGLLLLLFILIALIVSVCVCFKQPTETFSTRCSPAFDAAVHSPQCSPPDDMMSCMNSCAHGWCMDRQGGGKCVPGFLDGPFDPGVHCNNWWFQNMCMNGPLCRRTDVVPPPSLKRSWYHHPAPYDYRNMPWNNGTWCGLNRCYDKPVVLATVWQ